MVQLNRQGLQFLAGENQSCFVESQNSVNTQGVNLFFCFKQTKNEKKMGDKITLPLERAREIKPTESGSKDSKINNNLQKIRLPGTNL